MYFLALATDYDGTLAHDGVVTPETRAALQRFKASGRHIIMVTGRQMPDLKAAFTDLSLFDVIVAENGALLYHPDTGAEHLLVPPPPAGLVARLKARGVTPMSVGRGIIATWEPHEGTVLSVIHELGLEMQIVFNKGAVMVLRPGTSKATGLATALGGLGISLKNTVGVGDAENDHSFLAVCGLSAAVANALPPLKESCDITLTGRNGAGVAELAERVMAEDDALAPPSRHGIMIGRDRDGTPRLLGPGDGQVLLVGPSGCGKSTLATALTEQMADQGLSFCVLDPEGDYVELQHAVCIGSAVAPPNVADAGRLERNMGVNLVINTQALTLAERRRVFARLLTDVTRLREETGRPHWLVLDEAHEIAPARCGGPSTALPSGAPNALFVTMYPEMLDVEILKSVRTVLAFGPSPAHFLAAFADITRTALPPALPVPAHGELLFWQPASGRPPTLVHPLPPRQHHRRHIGKYATGDVGPWHSFYFRGRDNCINRPARNLYDFIDISNDIDDATWLYHLRAGDYAAWFRHVIRDEELALEADSIAEDMELSARDSRRRVKRAIWQRYAAPCETVTRAAIV
ncbi:MAG TPA: HAD hydrolase family protein [Acidisoma sp.]|jgi:hydroxymethylpyrimidine pyrophosphatase-like HAD family hydrolase|uniref:HAD hydrolase family protein n=1 Tax=Acidisoma sp. TaxID=1872115 RepID=UPI002BE1295F|nr:HAD hydrolase family protein [Acidisoma sp.]HTI00655.1 HAD hydrolase family protein [Acidisoma sp.]